VSLFRDALSGRKQKDTGAAQESTKLNAPVFGGAVFNGPVIDADEIIAATKSETRDTEDNNSTSPKSHAGLNDINRQAIPADTAAPQPDTPGDQLTQDVISHSDKFDSFSSDDQSDHQRSFGNVAGNFTANEPMILQEKYANGELPAGALTDPELTEHELTEHEPSQHESSERESKHGSPHAARTESVRPTVSQQLSDDAQPPHAGSWSINKSVNLDPLFFIIIAIASAGLFGSLYALVTQNDAFINQEYQDLRARQSSLSELINKDQDLLQDQQWNSDAVATDAGNLDEGTAALIDVNPDHHSNAELIGTDRDTAEVSRSEDVISQVAAEVMSQVAEEVDDVVVTTSAQSSPITAEILPAESDEENVVTLDKQQKPVAELSPQDTSRLEIVELKRHLEELRKTLAVQDVKIASLISENAVREKKQKAQTPEQSSKHKARGASPETTMSSTETDSIEGVSLQNPVAKEAGVPSTATGISIEDGVSIRSPVAEADVTGMNKNLAVEADSVDIRSTDLPDLVQQAFQAYSAGDLNLAGALYNRALELDPYNRDANLGVAAVAIGTQNYRVANRRYRHLLSLNPEDALAFSALLNLVATTRDSLAEHELKQHVAQYKNNAALHAALGNYFSQFARWDEASYAYGTAVGIAPETPDYLYNLAVTLDNLGDVNAARDTYQRAVSLSQTGSYTFDLNEVHARLSDLQAM